MYLAGIARSLFHSILSFVLLMAWAKTTNNALKEGYFRHKPWVAWSEISAPKHVYFLVDLGDKQASSTILKGDTLIPSP